MDNQRKQTQKEKGRLADIKTFPIALTISLIVLVAFIALGALAAFRCLTNTTTLYKDRLFIPVYGVIFALFTVWCVGVFAVIIMKWIKGSAGASYFAHKCFLVTALFAVGLMLYVVFDTAGVKTPDQLLYFYNFFMFGEMSTYLFVGSLIGLIPSIFARFENKELRAVKTRSVFNTLALIVGVAGCLLCPPLIGFGMSFLSNVVYGLGAYLLIAYLYMRLAIFALPNPIPFKNKVKDEQAESIKEYRPIVFAFEVVLAIAMVAYVLVMLMDLGMFSSGFESFMISAILPTVAMALLFVGLAVFGGVANSYFSDKVRALKKKYKEASQTAQTVQAEEKKEEAVAEEKLDFDKAVSLDEVAGQIYDLVRARGAFLGEKDAIKLLGAFMASKTVIIKCKDKDNQEIIARAIGDYFCSKAYLSKESEKWTDIYKFASSEDSDSCMLRGVYVANAKPDSVNVVTVIDSHASVANGYLAPLAEAMKKEEGTRYVSVGLSAHIPDSTYCYNGSLRVPENLWLVIFTSDEDEGEYCSEISDGAIYLRLDDVKCEKGEESARSVLSIVKFEEFLEKAREAYALPENWWRKLDGIEKFTDKAVGFTFDNVFIHEIEKFSAICGVCSMDHASVVDGIIGGVIVPSISARASEELRDKDHGVYSEINRLIGMENLPGTKEALKRFGLAR